MTIHLGGLVFFNYNFLYVWTCFPSFILLPLYSTSRCCKMTCTLACTCDLTCDLCFVPASPTRPLSLSAYHSFPQFAGSFCRKESCLGFGSCLALCKIRLLHLHVRKIGALALRNCITKMQPVNSPLVERGTRKTGLWWSGELERGRPLVERGTREREK